MVLRNNIATMSVLGEVKDIFFHYWLGCFILKIWKYMITWAGTQVTVTAQTAPWTKSATIQMRSEKIASRSYVSGPWQTFLLSPHNPRRGVCDSGRFCWPCLSPPDLVHAGKGLGLESHRALLGTSDPTESGSAATWRQLRPAVNIALRHSRGKKKKLQEDDILKLSKTHQFLV